MPGKQSSTFNAKLKGASENWWRIISGPGKFGIKIRMYTMDFIKL